MPNPTPAHLTALSTYLAQVYDEIVLSEEETDVRKAAVDMLEKDLHGYSDTLKGESSAELDFLWAQVTPLNASRLPGRC